MGQTRYHCYGGGAMLPAVVYRVLSGWSLAPGVSGCLLLHRWRLFLMDSASLVPVSIQVQCQWTYCTNIRWQGRCLECICKFLKFQVVVALYKCNCIILIFVVPSIMLYSSEISPTRCNNCVFILRSGFTLHVSGDSLTHHQQYICCIWPQVSRLT